MTTTPDNDRIRLHLEEQRVRLVDQLDDLGATPSGDLRSDVDFGDSFADAAATTSERTERLGLVESLKVQLDETDKALERLAEGGYGICASCEKPIPPARLEARPESTLCVECKSAHG
ncbi:hypothetical protein BH23ACT5_BH23ACT5_10910 [soil metagenome]